MGLMIALLIQKISLQEKAVVFSDSQLLVNQVKGIMRVKNIRLTQMMPILHDLILHLESLELNWVRREMNSVADMFARNAAVRKIQTAKEQAENPC